MPEKASMGTIDFKCFLFTESGGLGLQWQWEVTGLESCCTASMPRRVLS